MYVLNDHNSVLIAKPQTHILHKSKYPNSKTASTDRYYDQANLHLEFICQDTRHLNFICHGSEASDFVSFDPDWSPMKMSTLMEEVMADNTLGLHISTPVISSHDNVDLKSIMQLIENETDKKQPQEIANELELNQNDQTIIEFPKNPEVKTHSGRKIVAPERLTY